MSGTFVTVYTSEPDTMKMKNYNIQRRGVLIMKCIGIIVRLSTLLRFASEIKEMDINPLVATDRGLFAVDARIRIEK